MAGTKEGGRKAAAKNLAKDPDFYKKIGATGGKNGTTGGFAANPELAARAGAIGGRISRRTKPQPVEQTVEQPVHKPSIWDRFKSNKGSA